MQEIILTQAQKDELEQIGELYRKTIYDSSLVTLPDVVKAFGEELKLRNGDISSTIKSEVFRFHKLISSNYTYHMRTMIDQLHKHLSDHLPKNVMFRIICRQKSWESVLRKILKYYFEGSSIVLSDIVAFRIIIDSTMPEKKLEKICHDISNICIEFFTQKYMCTLMPPAKMVANNPLLKDYINYPKENGYKSIHLAFMDSKRNNLFEVQIRTQQMDADAEYGLEKDDEKNLDHENYKSSSYENFIEFISFDPELVIRPFFRVYFRYILDENKERKKITIIEDNIGLMEGKHIEERLHTVLK